MISFRPTGSTSPCGGYLNILLYPVAMLCWMATLTGCSQAADPAAAQASPIPPRNAVELQGVTYWNDRIRKVPWSIHVVKVDRSRKDLAFTTTLARNTIVGLSPLSSQLRLVPPTVGKPLVAMNGDFYIVDSGPYVGDPRGLQIMQGEYLSAPGDQTVFWLDAQGDPHLGMVDSKTTLTWPDGTVTAMRLNEERSAKETVLFTPRMGPATRTTGGVDAIVTRDGDGPWLPLQIGKSYTLKVKELVEGGNASLRGDHIVISFGPKVAKAATLKVGDTLKVLPMTQPSLEGARTAIGGGNIMVTGGQAQKFAMPATGAYKFRSVVERHPRSAIGFNDTHVFFVQVDGRQGELSVGMTLEELGIYMQKLGCKEAMNLDGGSSATLWVDGRVVNSPSSGGERDIANALVLVRKPTP